MRKIENLKKDFYKNFLLVNIGVVLFIVFQNIFVINIFILLFYFFNIYKNKRYLKEAVKEKGYKYYG